MPSARRDLTRLAALAACASLLAGAATACSTTQEKAAQHQAESKRILEARDQRKKQVDGPKTHVDQRKSAHRQREGEQ